ncbi:MAG TPA: polysaccharide lyase 8 family protein [Pseudonocardiaceae bacterium]|nr:polysaccharide lyase 8 family protein [Pseudonocardiaceae bacterium]
MSLRRRDLLRYGTVTTLSTVAVTALPGPAGAATPADTTTDFAAITAAYRALQVGTNQPSPERTQAVQALDEVAEQYDSTMDVTGGQLWTDLPSGPGSDYFPTMAYRLRTIAVDWATPGSALSAKPGMAQRIGTALDVIYRTEYNENTPEIGNWYSYEIGVPYWWLQILVSLGDQLTPTQRGTYLSPVLRFVADPNIRTNSPSTIETGANRADKALITVVSGALAGDADRIRTGIDAVTDVAGGGTWSLVSRVTTGDGYHTDGSFIQHGVVPYPGHYGLVLLTAAAGLIEVTSGTAFELPTDVRQKFYDTVADVYAPFVVSGAMMEPVRGRMLSRQGETGFDAGHQLTAAVVLLARSAPEPTRGQLAGIAARHIDDDSWAPYLSVSNLARFSGGLQMVGVPEVEYAKELLATRPKPAPVTATHRVFAQEDRLVHHAEGWSASLGVGSTRICRYESINGQNLHGWYVGDGVLYTFLPGDQGHYSDAYWPTVDATALPGTTTKDAVPPPLGSTPMGATAWVGGSRLDAGHGAHGMDFVSQDGTLSAKKSWFFTPDAVVCLGAAITDASGAPVRTTMENRNITGTRTRTLLVDGRPAPDTLGTTVTVPHADWLHLDGTGGYVLLERAPLTLLREDRTGTWYGVDTGANTHGTTVPYTRRFQKVLIGHGTNPEGASYAYAVLPGASPWRTRSSVGRFRVLANTTAVQAVALPDGVVGASFFTAGSVHGVAVSAPASVIRGPSRDGVTYAVADPTQLGTTVRVTVDRPGCRIVAHDPAATVVSSGRRLVVDVNVTGALGATHTFTVR